MSESNCRGWALISSAKKKVSIDNVADSSYSHPVSTGWSCWLHLTRRTVSTVFNLWKQINRWNGWKKYNANGAATRLKPGENEKKSACCFWMNVLSKKTRGRIEPALSSISDIL